jgi:hypothetical protein
MLIVQIARVILNTFFFEMTKKEEKTFSMFIVLLSKSPSFGILPRTHLTNNSNIIIIYCEVYESSFQINRI